MTRLEKAILFATKAHGFQKDKCGEIYILHPLRVMMALETEEEKIVGVLHDVLEDTKTSPQELEDLFGDYLTGAVESVSRGYTLKSSGASGLMIFKEVEERLATKETYKDFIRRSKLHPIGRKVKIADIKDNMLPERHDCLREDEKGIIKRYQWALQELEG